MPDAMAGRAADAAGPSVEIGPSRRWSPLKLRDLWEYRELLYFLIWRDIKIRYKQTLFGAAWAALQPLMTMVMFTIVFSWFAKVPSDDVPYPIFAFSALLPWTYFSQAIMRSAASLVASSHLVSKVYFPRLVVPIAAAIAPLVDFAVACAVLIGMMAWYRFTPTWNVLALPAFLILAFLTSLSIGLWLTALNVKYRDVGHTIPFLVQLWMYATPVAYPISLVPEQWRLLYSLNPMVGVVEGFRWGLLGKSVPDLQAMSISTCVVVILLIGGLYYFKRTERTFADII